PGRTQLAASSAQKKTSIRDGVSHRRSIGLVELIGRRPANVKVLERVPFPPATIARKVFLGAHDYFRPVLRPTTSRWPDDSHIPAPRRRRRKSSGPLLTRTLRQPRFPGRSSQTRRLRARVRRLETAPDARTPFRQRRLRGVRTVERRRDLRRLAAARSANKH